MMDWEHHAAEHAERTGVYVTWQSQGGGSRAEGMGRLVSSRGGGSRGGGRVEPQVCTRIGPDSGCFCGHKYSEHTVNLKKNSFRCGATGKGEGNGKRKQGSNITKSSSSTSSISVAADDDSSVDSCSSSSNPAEHRCMCERFNYMPSRPEEVGEWYLVRRKGFDARAYMPKCSCKHSFLDHDPSGRMHRCMTAKCGCKCFKSAFLCVVCDRHSEEHETVWETEAERRTAGFSVGKEFYPLSELPDVQDLVFAKNVR